MELLNKIIIIGIYISFIGCQSQQSDKINSRNLIEWEKETPIGEPSVLTSNDIVRFDSLFQEWRYTYRTDMQMRISSNTNDAKKLEQYPLLLEMGKKSFLWLSSDCWNLMIFLFLPCMTICKMWIVLNVWIIMVVNKTVYELR